MTAAATLHAGTIGDREHTKTQQHVAAWCKSASLERKYSGNYPYMVSPEFPPWQARGPSIADSAINRLATLPIRPSKGY